MRLDQEGVRCCDTEGLVAECAADLAVGEVECAVIWVAEEGIELVVMSCRCKGEKGSWTVQETYVIQVVD